jgi:hypothetical protein
MARRLTKWQTLATNSSTAVATSAIGDTSITILSGLQTHFIKINGTADNTSIVIPQGAVIDFEIPVGATISALTHSGSGHITVLYY